ncbi:MAG: chemotaxis protein CheX [Myxococcaceae bacterium]
MSAPTPLPQPPQLAQMVSNVTETMLGIRFQADRPSHVGELQAWRTAVLPIPGRRPLTVGLASDEQGCKQLSAAMFSVPPDQVDASMINDAMRELVNMTAGLVKSRLASDQALGLPKVVDGAARASAPSEERSVCLKADGLGLLLWVAEGIHHTP